ncbi:Cytoplasmic dynein 1 light intermediate chain 2, variant 3 [Schistosoma haematobium]|uniref:Dynein light intermediate chain n=1 Tax=Schistosoma haematobium TaxID=6185 RepID=A0A922LSG1_SCHHA|nr:Cytoplasmic dynein 1 light intermediate chain 2, variant 3 [Schistosoma haematobium]KAH9592285.1 Cytoplasmic dynein 1 light intermediate chain 2, variant 3 [Schistosoma haematobium]
MPHSTLTDCDRYEEGDLCTEKKHLCLLEEVTHKAAVTLSPSKTLVVLGDDECGKTTLMARLQGTEDPKKGFGLEYTLLDIKDEDRDDQTKLNVWILDGNTIHSHLLKFAINEESFGDCFIMICVSMMEPWNIISSLNKWVGILREHIGNLKVSNEKLQEYKKNILRQFCSYLEPDVLSNTAHVAPMCISPSGNHQPNGLVSPKKLSGIHPATAALLSSTLNSLSETASQPPPVINVEQANISMETNTDENALINNLGIPIVVVMTKADSMGALEKENQFTEEHFDFIQMHVRRFCLSYGAALFYVSVKEDKNCDLLNRYLQSRIYGFPFSQTAYVVERDCIFVPAGWDNLKKIGILEENLTQVQPHSLYSDVVPPPPSKKAAVREPELFTQDDQSFLTRLSVSMQRDNTQANISNNTISGNSDSVMDQLGTTTALMNTSSNVGSRPVSGSPRTPGSAGRSKPPSAVGGAAGTTGGPGPGASEGVLANFFNSLLSKRTPVVGGVGGIGTSASLSTQGSLDRTSISQKDIQSELKRLAQSSREALDVGDNGPEQLLGDVRQQKLDEMKSVVSSSPKPTKTTSSTNEQPSQV